MATIESRPSPNGIPGFRVRIRLKGTPAVSATFPRRTDAKRWAQATEAAIREGRYFKNAAAKSRTVADLIDKYIAEILPTKSHHAVSQKSQLLWWKQELGHLSLAKLSPGEIGQRRDTLLARERKPGQRVSAATVNRYLAAGVSGLRGAKTRHPGGADQDARPSARVAPAVRGAAADVEAAEAVEADDAAFSHTGGNRRGQRGERAAGFGQAHLRIGGDLTAQRGLADGRHVFGFVIRGIGDRLAGARVAPGLLRYISEQLQPPSLAVSAHHVARRHDNGRRSSQ